METKQTFNARMMVKVPDITVINILKRIKDGGLLEDVAREYQIPPGTIKGWCMKAGISLPRKRRDWDEIKRALGIA